MSTYVWWLDILLTQFYIGQTQCPTSQLHEHEKSDIRFKYYSYWRIILLKTYTNLTEKRKLIEMF